MQRNPSTTMHWQICVDSKIYCFADDGQNPTGEALLYKGQG